jgi:cbb3-type cytochrome oxidase cytochrome c subunit
MIELMRERWSDLILVALLVIAGGVLVAKGVSLLESFWYAPSGQNTSVQKRSPLDNLSVIERGKLVFQSAGCTSCHLARLEPGGPLVGFPVGPSLSNVGMRRDERWLREHYIDPHKLVPGSKMNSFAYLPTEELDALVAYIKTFTPQREPAEEPNIVIAERFTQEQVERGKALFTSERVRGLSHDREERWTHRAQSDKSGRARAHRRLAIAASQRPALGLCHRADGRDSLADAALWASLR